MWHKKSRGPTLHPGLLGRHSAFNSVFVFLGCIIKGICTLPVEVDCWH